MTNWVSPESTALNIPLGPWRVRVHYFISVTLAGMDEVSKRDGERRGFQKAEAMQGCVFYTHSHASGYRSRAISISTTFLNR